MLIYLDNAATTRPADSVIETVTACLTEDYGNPSSLHKMGLNAELRIAKARKNIADALGTEKETIFFTSGATESSNLALRGAAAVYGKRKKQIITSAVEHASVRSTLNALEEDGFEIIRIPPRTDGRFYAEDFLNAVTGQTFLISMMLVENETGRTLPVSEVFRNVGRKHPDVIRHCDAVQAFMKLPVRVKDLQADLISLSAHKIHGVKGAGGLYIRKGIRISPLMTGGKQEKSIRPGTESVPLIAGFGEAVSIMLNSIQQRYEQMQSRKEFLLKLLSDMPEIVLNSETDPAFSSPYIVNFSVKGIRSEIMLHYLESREIYVSSGSACSKGAQSGVLSAYSIPDSLADCAVRVSFSEETTEQDLLNLVQAVADGQKHLIHKK